ncbi:DUF7678 domain-containing protein [Acetivibrio cellulolyticus]|uniref:DUF7678 domain-containing protein n=1 Tax=Acetivibrio cellulolyticus TaxID=35830 RepID=UPI0001E2D985|nr:hypothetical protein [Acetivibrio cellulolyticus]
MGSSGEYAGLIWEANFTDVPTRYGINQGRVYYLEIKKVEHHDGYTTNQIFYRFERGWVTIDRKYSIISEVVKHVMELYE